MSVNIVAFEGMDFGGKSMLSRRLHKVIGPIHSRLFQLPNPASPYFVEIKQLLNWIEEMQIGIVEKLDTDARSLTAHRIMHSLMMADRLWVRNKLLREYLLEKKYPEPQILIFDRYYHSSAAYQFLAGEVGEMLSMEAGITLPRPDMVCHVAVPEKIRDHRRYIRKLMGTKPSPFESPEYLERVGQRYNEMFSTPSSYGIELTTLDGNANIRNETAKLLRFMRSDDIITKEYLASFIKVNDTLDT